MRKACVRMAGSLVPPAATLFIVAVVKLFGGRYPRS
jgi:hypothetical protein